MLFLELSTKIFRPERISQEWQKESARLFSVILNQFIKGFAECKWRMICRRLYFIMNCYETVVTCCRVESCTRLEGHDTAFKTPANNFDVLLIVHLSIILAINQLNAQNLLLHYNKFITRLYTFRALCAHHQGVKIVLYSIWYHHTCTWPSGAQFESGLSIIQFWLLDDEHIVLETCRGV